MSQTGFELFSKIAEMGLAIFDVVILYALWNVFYRSAKEKATMIAGGILLFVNVVLKLIPGVSIYGRLLASAVLMLPYSYMRYKKHCEKTVLIISLFYGFRSLIFLVANSVSQYLYASIYQTADDMFLDLVYARALYYGVYAVLFALILIVLQRTILHANKMSWYDVCFLSILNVVGGLFAEIIANISIVKLNNDFFDLFSIKAEMFWKLPLISVLLFLGELSAITIYQKYRELQRERELYFVEQQQVKAMKRRLEEAENFYGSIRKVRHEMKNHMTNIKSLVAGEQYAEVESYISKLDGAIGELDYKYSTGNAVTDVIINDKWKKAEKAAIRFDAKFACGNIKGVDIFDLGIVLNNLLDNAIEACEKIEPEKRFIQLSLIQKKNFLLLEVENSFDGELITARDGLPQTTKGVKLPQILMGHGIGLRNVKEIAGRYLGTMDIKTSYDTFKAIVMLQLQKERGNEL